MLAIRMQRTGRKGHAQFRVVVQESRLTPTSGRVVANIGNYDPHTKVTNVDKEKATFYLTNGAQPSERAARLLKDQGVKLPSWVKLAEQKERKIRNPEKLRSNQPAAPEAPVEEAPVAEAPEATEATETTAEAVVTEDTPVEAGVSEESPVAEEVSEVAEVPEEATADVAADPEDTTKAEA